MKKPQPFHQAMVKALSNSLSKDVTRGVLALSTQNKLQNSGRNIIKRINFSFSAKDTGN